MNFISVPTKFGIVQIDSGTHCNSDFSVLNEIIDRDDYRVQRLHADGFAPETIFDCGCNHGIFSWLCGKLWPEAHIFCFEPQPSYVRQAMVNLPERAHVIGLPLLGFPARREPELHEDQRDWASGRSAIRGLDARDTLQLLTRGETLLKLDVEGSGTNIIRSLGDSGFLLEPNMLPLFNVITGEWHFALERETVMEILPKTHHLEIEDHGGETGLFFARRK